MEPEILIATCAVFVSIMSLLSSIYFGWCTRDHNKRSVKPLPYVLPSDFEDHIIVRIWNNGSGPLILNKVIAHNKKDKTSGHLIDLVPSPPIDIYFNNFTKVAPGRAILPSHNLNLLDFEVDENDSNAVHYREQLRNHLGNIEIQIEYTDIYDLKFPTYKKELTWFHR